jgi:hypothetical protein
MISLALGAALTSTLGAHAYRVAISGPAGSSVVVAAQPPPGWTATFCSARFCSVGHVLVTISAAGTSYVDLHLYFAAGSNHGAVLVTARGDRDTRSVHFTVEDR